MRWNSSYIRYFFFIISSIASPASHFFIITTFLPTKIDIRNATWLPVAWNKGTQSRIEDSELASGVALYQVLLLFDLNSWNKCPTKHWRYDSRCDDKTPLASRLIQKYSKLLHGHLININIGPFFRVIFRNHQMIQAIIRRVGGYNFFYIC